MHNNLQRRRENNRILDILAEEREKYTCKNCSRKKTEAEMSEMHIKSVRLEGVGLLTRKRGTCTSCMNMLAVVDG